MVWGNESLILPWPSENVKQLFDNKTKSPTVLSLKAWMWYDTVLRNRKRKIKFCYEYMPLRVVSSHCGLRFLQRIEQNNPLCVYTYSGSSMVYSMVDILMNRCTIAETVPSGLLGASVIGRAQRIALCVVYCRPCPSASDYVSLVPCFLSVSFYCR